MEFSDTMIAKERDTEYYIDKARELAALVAENTERINEQRKIPTDVSNEIADAGFFRLLMPRNLGGAQLDHPDFLRIAQIIAEADGSVGWSFNQNNVFATNSTRMNDKTREEIYGNPRAVITNGPPMARSRAVEVDGGYSLSGRWNFSSGSDHATWIAALTPIQDTDDNGASPAEMVSRDDMRILLIPKDEVEMVNNWQVNGLRGTASWGFEADGLFIPKHRMYNPGSAPREDGAVYRIPTSLLFASGFGTVAMGAARAALDAAKELAKRKVPGNMDHGDAAAAGLVNDTAAGGRSGGYLAFGAGVPARGCGRGVGDGVCGGSAYYEPAHTHEAGKHACESEGSGCGGYRVYAVRVVGDIREQSGAATIPGCACDQSAGAGRLTHYDTAGRFFMGMDPGRDGLF